MIAESYEDQVADEYFQYLNTTLTPMSFGLGAMIISGGFPHQLAWLVISVVLLLAFYKGRDYRKVVESYLPKNSHIVRKFVVTFKVVPFFISAMWLNFIAVELVSKSVLMRLFS